MFSFSNSRLIVTRGSRAPPHYTLSAFLNLYDINFDLSKDGISRPSYDTMDKYADTLERKKIKLDTGITYDYLQSKIASRKVAGKIFSNVHSNSHINSKFFYMDFQIQP